MACSSDDLAVLYWNIEKKEHLIRYKNHLWVDPTRTHPTNVPLNGNLGSQTSSFIWSTIVLQCVPFQCEQLISVQTVQFLNDLIGKAFSFQPLFHFVRWGRLLNEYFRCLDNIQNATLFSENCKNIFQLLIYFVLTGCWYDRFTGCLWRKIISLANQLHRSLMNFRTRDGIIFLQYTYTGID